MLGLLICVLAQSPDVVATDLKGGRLTGSLVRIDKTKTVLATPDGEKVIRMDQLIDLRWGGSKKVSLPPGQVYLLDGSALTFSSLATNGRELVLSSPIYGELKLVRNVVRAIRFRELNLAAGPWRELLERVRSKDVLVLPKKQRAGELDPTTGVVGKIDEKNITFVLGGDEIPVKLSRVYGVIYARKPTKPKGGFVIEAGSRDRLIAESIEWNSKTQSLVANLSSGARLNVAGSYLNRVDCSGGKIRYLDEMTPISYEFTPILPDKLAEKIFRYRTNKTMDGKPLRLGGKTYDRGLWIHSRSVLRYSLGGDFSRLEAVTGIDDEIPRRDKTKARLTIKADKRVVFDEDIWTTDKPRLLKCDLAGAQMLEIVVDFGEKRDDGRPPLDASLQDWVDLAEAKVVK